MCSKVSRRRAELDCSVLEEDWQTGQSYMAHWHSLTVIPEHQHRPTVVEAEQRSAQQREARMLLQRFLSGAISKNSPHDPKPCSSRRPRQPSSRPSAVGPTRQQDPVYDHGDGDCSVNVRPKNAVLDFSERKTVVKIAKLPRFLG